MNTVYLSKERLEELKQEFERLKSQGRQEIAERLRRAKDLGDLSENSEYQEAREAQNRLEARIAELQDIIRNAEVIKKSGGTLVVKIGSTVRVQKDKKTLFFTVVGSNEAQPEKGFISNESPLGKALLNKKAGDTVEVQTPAGKAEYKILAIE